MLTNTITFIVKKFFSFIKVSFCLREINIHSFTLTSMRKTARKLASTFNLETGFLEPLMKNDYVINMKR